MKLKKVYVVFEKQLNGEHVIISIRSSKVLANKLANQVGDIAHVEEWELDTVVL